MAKPKLPKIINIGCDQVTLTCPGGWDRGGSLVYTYNRLLEEGTLEVISKGHLYHWKAGRDLYPTEEQLVALLANQPVTFGIKQWA